MHNAMKQKIHRCGQRFHSLLLYGQLNFHLVVGCTVTIQDSMGLVGGH